jgi:hypothetical protein
VPDSTLFSYEQLTGGLYTEYWVSVLYLENEGLCALPLAAPTGAQRIVRLHAPSMRKVVLWHAKRYGDKPHIPHWGTGASNEVLMKKMLGQVHLDTSAGQQQHIYTQEGIYVYELQVPLGENDRLPTAAPVVFSTPPELLHIEPAQFDHNMLRSINPAGFGGGFFSG